MNKKCRITIRLSQHTKDDLQVLADDNKRKLSDYIRVELETICEEKKEIINKKSDKS